MLKTLSHAIVYLTTTIVCLMIYVEPSISFALNSKIQQQEVRTITADTSKRTEVPKQNKQGDRAKNSAAPQTPSPAMLCSLGVLLLLDDIKKVQVIAFNGPANATVNFATTQTNAGIIGMSHSSTGPFVASIVVPVQLDGNGNGTSDIFYVQGLQVGTTVLFATSAEMGPTTTLDYEVLPQCNCPPIPIVP
ncbi:MAG TPA: hypothetical protein VJR02_04185 [Pyrinomonadaceae bacterium]|nr:hypothetical protein [Pyrinomonadaceae bacterium]